MSQLARQMLIDALLPEPEAQFVPEPKMVYDEVIEGEKRKRGRPRKVDSHPRQLSQEATRDRIIMAGAGNAVARQERLELQKKRDRINPKPKGEDKAIAQLQEELRDFRYYLIEVQEPRLKELTNMEYEIGELTAESEMGDPEDVVLAYKDYKEAMEDFNLLMKRTRFQLDVMSALLENKEIDPAEELAVDLRNRGKELDKAYSTLYKAYDEVTEALCDIIAEAKAEKGDFKGGLSHVEKRGFGMLQGESGQSYQIRQRKLGNGKVIPKTIRLIDRKVEETEQRWRSVAGISQSDFWRIKANWRKTMRATMRKSSIAVNLTDSALDKMLVDCLHSVAKDLDESNWQVMVIGAKGLEAAAELTQRMYGTEKSLKADDREKYGCLHTIVPTEKDNIIGSQYGDIVVRLKPHKVVATMLCGDSLCMQRDGLNFMSPSLLCSPSPCSFSPDEKVIIDHLRTEAYDLSAVELAKLFRLAYIEIQLHGRDQYNADSIESISFGSDQDLANLSYAAYEAIQKFQIPMYIKDKPVVIAEDGEIKTKDEVEAEKEKAEQSQSQSGGGGESPEPEQKTMDEMPSEPRKIRLKAGGQTFFIPVQ